MATNNESIKSFKIQNLFDLNDEYLIPIYQRNYAWQEAQIVQLVEDIADYAEMNKNNEVKKTYYIGTIVVFEKIKNGKTIYETIDGQQRLTTLSILLSVLKNNFNMKINFKSLLRFESRKTSTETLEKIYSNNGFSDNSNPTMKNAYDIINKSIKLKNEEDRKIFKDYLWNHVEILRVCVPEDTDLNHYFEIMNNRGEQLEKHEVLKSYMLAVFKEEEIRERKVFSKIWDACSDMSRYVQYGFSTSERVSLFGDNWDKFNKINFDNVLEILKEYRTSGNNDMSLQEIINKKEYEDNKNKNDDKKTSERFTSPINFQNFLLHVLRIQKKEDDIPLDDKRLLDTFKLYLEEKDFVQTFGFNLLKARYLFDNYILKRDYSDSSKEDGEWSLKKLLKGTSSAQYNNSFGDEQNDNPNKKLVKLLSMFHVSNPSQIYKHWLTGALNYLCTQDENNINANEYIIYLQKQAELFLKNNYLAHTSNSYKDIIFNDNLKINTDINLELLNQGTNVENFIFNYLDYLLWDKDTQKYKDFNFTFRSSVEHFYPQNPLDGQDKLDDLTLNSFGNLCLISASKNSRLSNYQPEAKSDHYYKSGYDSPKQMLMMEKMKESTKWWKDEIKSHQTEMINLLIGDLNNAK
ncbi:DUF262 domain-containing protein [Aliarcobacter butzleri]|uniref:DUF262 domain-containing protein n=1 Tax=Aliarcobacter butzleri TaxID=28197 RepID=UPI002B2467CC|nr:DUF262 domain-containing HNH endonuclease family protein [Aliarcobacter butzleri]